MKKMTIYVVFLVILIFVLRSCTVVNLSPTLLFNGGKFKQFPELQNNLQAKTFSIYRTTQTREASIKYYPTKNFFVIFNYEEGLVNPIKIDGVGNKVFELELREKQGFDFLDMINCFVIGKTGIYDLSEEKPVYETFSEVHNQDGNFTKKDWVERFGNLYKTNDIVLYSIRTENNSISAAYFKQNGTWIKLYTPQDFIYPGTGSEIICKINGKEIPHKWHEEIYLKDVENATYSNENRYTDAYITPYNFDHTFFPEQSLKYPKPGNLKTLAFAKEDYTTEGYYNPGIPNHFYGTGYYGLEIDNDILNFKTVASKANFGGKLETDLHLFGLPEKFANRSSVRFLSYDYGTNFHENNTKGVYVIKKNLMNEKD
ncbi:hypothetical protein [Pedobacter aquatilis]|uniref:hypothetical protein n=1 Tax=Pedobacter aquatilis TaxID=351343 RepID=UPI00292F26C8|nr:hypothetical protein [Pedobacter aquatilis]